MLAIGFATGEGAHKRGEPETGSVAFSVFHIVCTSHSERYMLMNYQRIHCSRGQLLVREGTIKAQRTSRLVVGACRSRQATCGAVQKGRRASSLSHACRRKLSKNLDEHRSKLVCDHHAMIIFIPLLHATMASTRARAGARRDGRWLVQANTAVQAHRRRCELGRHILRTQHIVTH